MPFSGPDDPDLPPNARRLSAKKRRQWVTVWNSSFRRNGDEGRAFRAANAAVKEAEMPEDDEATTDRTSPLVSAETARVIAEDSPDPQVLIDYLAKLGVSVAGASDGLKADGSKHGDGGFGERLPVTTVGPFGGAETFADYDSWKKAAALQTEVDILTITFDGLISNIRNDPELELSEKATRIAAVAGELGRRVEAQNSAHRDEDEKALDEPASETFWFEAKDFGYQYADDQGAFAEKVATKRDAGVELRASDFADVLDAEKPSTWKLPLVRGRSGGFDLGRIADAITALQPGGFRGQRVQLGSPKGRVVSRVRAAIGRAPGDAKRKTALRERLAKVKESGDGGMFRVFRDKSGALRWFTIHSNDYVDKEGERFAAEAHDEFVRWVDEDKAGRMPELRVFHIPGSGLGRADLIDHTSEGFMLASGTFYPEMEYVAKGLSDRDDLGCSHGFWFDPDAFQQGVYHRYRSFEISILPQDRAANEATGFIAGKEVPLMDPEKKAFLEGVVGAEHVDKVEAAITALSKEIDEEGATYKNLVAALTAPTATKDDSDDDPPPKQKEEAPAKVELDAEALKPISEAVAAVADQVKAVTASLEQQGAQIVALKESDATKIAEAFRPRIAPKGGFVASESEKSETDDDSDEVAKAKDVGAVPAALGAYFSEDGGLRGFGTPGATAVPAPAPATTP